MTKIKLDVAKVDPRILDDILIDIQHRVENHTADWDDVLTAHVIIEHRKEEIK